MTSRDYGLTFVVAAVAAVTLAFLTGTTVMERLITMGTVLVLVFVTRQVMETVKGRTERLNEAKAQLAQLEREAHEERREFRDSRRIQEDRDREELLTETFTSVNINRSGSGVNRTINGVENPRGVWRVLGTGCGLPRGSLILQDAQGRYVTGDDGGTVVGQHEFQMLLDRQLIEPVPSMSSLITAPMQEAFAGINRAFEGIGVQMGQVGARMDEAFAGLDETIADLDREIARVDREADLQVDREGDLQIQNQQEWQIREPGTVVRTIRQDQLQDEIDKLKTACDKAEAMQPEARSAWDRILDDDFE